MAEKVGNWLITGASSGFGEALANAVLENGGKVTATFRKLGQAEAFAAKAPGRSFAVLMDVCDAESVDSGVAKALKEMGVIDVLVNNAGYALRGLQEQISDKEALQQLDTNVMGVLRVTRAVVPSMRARKSGHIINIASTASTCCFPALGLYCASKHAVLGLTGSLAQELGSLGIRVTSVEPGGFKTSFGTSSMVHAAASPPDDYTPMLDMMAEKAKDPKVWGRGDPDIAAERLIQLTQMAEPPTNLALGDDALPMIKGAIEARLASYEEHAALGQGTSFE